MRFILKQSSGKNENHLISNIQMGFAMVFLSLGWAMWSSESHLNSDVKERTGHQSELPSLMAPVNRSMQLTQKQKELLELAVETENSEVKQYYGSSIEYSPPDKGLNLQSSFESENTAKKIYDDITGSGRNQHHQLPTDRITSLLEQEQWVAKADKRQLAAFVQTFKENARSAGYDIVVGPDLKVISVKRIPQSERSSRLDSTTRTLPK